MHIHQAPQCPRNQLHRVHRLAQLAARVLKIKNHQGQPTIRSLEAEAPRWWATSAGSNSMRSRDPDAPLVDPLAGRLGLHEYAEC